MATRKLSREVTLHERDADGKLTGRSGTFGPDDELPDWAAKAVDAIDNPDVWADSPAADDAGEGSSTGANVGDAVPDGSIEKVVAWVQEDPAKTADRIAAARTAEQAKGDKARSGLLTRLDELAAG